MPTVTYKCPNCDGGLLFDPSTQKYHCEYCQSSFSQEELDALFSGSSGPEDVPKGLQSRTLERIRTHLAQAPEEGCTCESLAAQAGLSSVTVRRYLTYLTQQGEVVSRVNYDTGGRPSLLYYLPNGRP